jgi:hypothetical protein
MSSKSNILVEVPVHCSRKDKTLNARVPLDEAEALVQGAETRTRNAQMLSKQFGEVSPDQLPHLIVVYKGQVVILSTVHDSNDEAVKRALNAAIGSDAFEVPPPQKRKKSETPSE